MKESKRNTLLEFNNNIEYLICMLEDVRYVSLKKLKDISAEELHWQYQEGWNTIASLLEHINALYIFFKIKYLENRDWTKEEEDELTPALSLGEHLPKLISNHGLEYYLAKLEATKTPMYEAINQLDLKSFKEKREGYNDNYNLAWLLYHLAEDEIHHRGQITLLRKLYAASQIPHPTT